MHICIRIGASGNMLIKIYINFLKNQFPQNIVYAKYIVC